MEPFSHSIFNELESNGSIKLDLVKIIREMLSTGTGVFQPLAFRVSYMGFAKDAVIVVPTDIVLGPLVYAIINILTMFCFLGPFVCIGLSAWRLRKRDYGASNGEASLANLTPALNFFYTLVICQGVLYYFLINLVNSEDVFVHLFYKQCKFPEEWGRRSVANYLQDTREKCVRDPSLAEGRSLLSYAIGLLDSESQEEYLSGARMLDILINDGEDASTDILRSRPKIQRLLDKLGWRSCSNTESESGDKDAEIRMLSARIVADLAGGIQLAQFPGAIWSVSSLLETTGQPIWNNIKQHELSLAERRAQKWDRLRAVKVKLFPQQSNLAVVVEHVIRKAEGASTEVEKVSSRIRQIVRVHFLLRRKKAETGRSQGEGDDVNQNKVVDGKQEIGGHNELILQGLRIFERLASDPHNCTDICAAPGLVVKITAPLYSATLIQDIANNMSWAGLVNESLRALQRLIHVGPSTSLRNDMLSDKQVMSNLESILHLRCEAAEVVCQELQMQAIEILTQLVLHSSSANIIISRQKGRSKRKYQQANVGSKKKDQQTNDSSKEKDQQANEDDEADVKELLEAQLSLTLVLREQLFCAESSTPVIQENDPDGGFVKKLKAIVDDNCQATPVSLRIIKLCSQIVASIMRRNRCASNERKEFVESVSKASKAMANLESCMLFAGPDSDLKKTARPLLSVLETELKRLAA
uniref:Uncharacterized protein n=1 Tax=Oryza punctata TaxID=4537 RepID=A0A0E0MDI4_ORYPU